MLFPRSGERKRALLARLTGLFGPTRPPPDTPHPARRGLFFPAEDRSTAVLSASSSPDLMTTVSTWLDPTGSRAWVLGGLRLRSGGLWGIVPSGALRCHRSAAMAR